MSIDVPVSNPDALKNRLVKTGLTLLFILGFIRACYADPEAANAAIDNMKNDINDKGLIGYFKEEDLAPSDQPQENYNNLSDDEVSSVSPFFYEEVYGYQLLCGTLGGDDGEGGEFNSAWAIFQRLKKMGLDVGGPVVVLKGDEVKVRHSRTGLDYLYDAKLTKFCVPAPNK